MTAKDRFSALLNSKNMEAFAAPFEAWGAEQRAAWAALEAVRKLISPESHLPEFTFSSGSAPFVHRGHFRVEYLAKHADFVPKLIAHLQQCESAYAGAGIRFQGTVPVAIKGKGKSNRPFYLKRWGDAGFIQFVPRRLNREEDLEISVHEMAHYLHNEWLPSGFQNKHIRSQFEEHENDENTGGSRIEALRDEIVDILAEIRKLARRFFRKGREFPSEGYEVLGTRKGKHLLWLPEVKIRYRGNSTGTWANIRSVAYMLPDIEKRAIEDLLEIYERAAKDYNYVNQQQSDDKYQSWRSKWVPTDYAKTNHKEWFAEVLTATLLHPDKVDPEVKEWVLTVARTGVAPEKQHTPAKPSSSSKVETPAEPVKLPENNHLRKKYGALHSFVMGEWGNQSFRPTSLAVAGAFANALGDDIGPQSFKDAAEYKQAKQAHKLFNKPHRKKIPEYVQDLYRLNQQALAREFGDTITLYRGIPVSEAPKIYADIQRGMNQVSIPVRYLSSWTVLRQAAVNEAMRDSLEGVGVLLQITVPREQIAFSYLVANADGHREERIDRYECVLRETSGKISAQAEVTTDSFNEDFEDADW